MSPEIDKEMMDKLYEFEKHGVPRTHLECLMWFHHNKGQVVDPDTIKGKKANGVNANGNKLQRRIPIPANNIVKGLHYLHSGVRGSYKPGGAKLIDYDQTKETPQIWEGEDIFIQSIQTGDGKLTGYGKEIEFDKNGQWFRCNYNHLPKKKYFEIDNGWLQSHYDHKIPIGIIYKKGKSENEILGLGLITNVSNNKLDYTLEPYTVGNKMSSQFQFVEKDFFCKKTQADAKYRHGRIYDLYKAVVPKLNSRFNDAKNDIILTSGSRKRKSSQVGNYWERDSKKGLYRNYSWFGIWLVKPESNVLKPKKDFIFSSRDTVQFQIGLNERDPLWAGIYIDQSCKKTKKRILELLENKPDECLKKFKNLSGYVIKCGSNEAKLLGEWETSELDKDDIDEIIKTYSQKHADFRVCKIFTKEQALKL